MQIYTMEGAPDPLPHNIEAEQQVLGGMMLDDETIPKIAAILSPRDFAEPAHQRIAAAAFARHDRGELVSPVALKAVLEHDDGLQELGGPSYLARLAGAGALSYAIEDLARLIKDASNRRAVLQIIRDAQAALVRGEEATGDVMGRLETALVSLGAADTQMKPVSFLAAATAAIREIDDGYHDRARPGVAPPWAKLSRIIPAFRPGDMVVLGGRPSMGKSSIALSLATAAARDGHPVVIASLEMTPEDMAMRALSEWTSEMGNAVPYTLMSNGAITEAQFRATVDAAKASEALPIMFLSEDFRTPGKLMAGVKQALDRMGPMGGKTPLIMVDYMQLMQGQGRDLREQITDVSKQMKHLARTLGAVNLSISQLSRAVEQRADKRPMLSDLRETGQVEQDADAVLFCYRREYYLERERPDESNPDAVQRWQAECERERGRLELIVAKQRRGPIGTAHLRFYAACNRVWED